jgi:hypothetical protein
VRERLDRYEVVDFLALLFGYALSGERTLQTFLAHVGSRMTSSRCISWKEPGNYGHPTSRIPEPLELSRLLSRVALVPLPSLFYARSVQETTLVPQGVDKALQWLREHDSPRESGVLR